MILFSGSGSSSSGGRNLLDVNTGDENAVYYDEWYGGQDDIWNFSDGSNDYSLDGIFGNSGFWPFGIIAVLGTGLLLLIAAAAIAVNVFVCNPIEVGGCRFFVENSYGNSGAGLLFYAFQSGYYGKIVLTLFLRNLFNALWYLLLIVPGIVKAYEYRMIPYLLADHPEFDRQEVFRVSKEMMDGQKMNAFILDLSFIGWNLLSAITFGLVGVFYSNSYKNATDAELYLELRQQYLGSGRY